MKSNRIIFSNQAEGWQHGCLLGNGFMGEVFLGRTDSERIELSNSTFFSGSQSDNFREDASMHYKKLRSAAIADDFDEMSKETELFMGLRENFGTNLPVGSLVIDFKEPDCSNYKRGWDLDNGIAGCEFLSEGYSQKREAFSSYVDRMFVYRIESDNPKGIDFDLSMDFGRNPGQINICDDKICFKERALENIHSDGNEGTKLWGIIKISTDGKKENAGSKIVVKSSTKAIISLNMITDYGLEDSTASEVKDLEMWNRLDRELICITDSDYNLYKERHCDDFKALMGRQNLTLCDEENDVEATELFDRCNQTGDNKRLTEVMYQMGRYLLISSSRVDSPLPAPLQGIWNDDVACRIGWTCDMHLDINSQMNYWISEAGNISECHKPVFKWVEKTLLPEGKKVAEKCYGFEGWLAELVSNAWGYSAPYWNRALSPCPASGMWLISDYVEHYRYNEDDKFLKEHVMPVLFEATTFAEKYVWEKDGVWHCGPSISPENSFIKDGKKYYASNDCTFEVLMIRKLLSEYSECYEKCEENNLFDDELKKDDYKHLYDKALIISEGLMPYRILKDGTLAEWSHDYKSGDEQHRHTSHLLGVFPYAQIIPKRDNELVEAVKKSLNKKLTPYENWEDTGWARNMLTLYFARLHEGENALFHLKESQRKLTNDNLLVFHPPTRGAGAFREVYELDGNTGFSMSVMEMLIQSHTGKVELLPALPMEWSRGKITGVKVRGGVEIDLEWKNCRPEKLKLRSDKDKEIVINFGDDSRILKINKGAEADIRW